MEEARSEQRRRERKELRTQLRSRSLRSGNEVASGKVRELLEWFRTHSGDYLTHGGTDGSVCGEAVTLNGSFGRILENALKPPEEQGERKRNLMQLPLWPDVVHAMEDVRGDTKTKANRALRVRGFCCGVAWWWSVGASRKELVPPAARATSQQESALNRIWELVKVFVDDNPENRSWES